MESPQRLRLHLRVLGLRRQGRRAHHQPRPLEAISNGASATSLLNQLDPAEHDFIYGDVFDWLRRLAKKGPAFDVILLDPPTFSQSKESGVFRAEKDYGRLVTAALPLLKPAGCCSPRPTPRSCRRNNFLPTWTGRSRAQTDGPSAPLRAAAAGFPHLARRTRLLEDSLAADRVIADRLGAARPHSSFGFGVRTSGLRPAIPAAGGPTSGGRAYDRGTPRTQRPAAGCRARRKLPCRFHSAQPQPASFHSARQSRIQASTTGCGVRL